MSRTDIEWTCGSLLSQGIHGTKIFFGVDSNGRLMAAKQAQSSQATLVRVMRKSIEILETVQHKNIVRYYGVNESLETLTLFTEYISGGDISSLMQPSQYGTLTDSLTKSILVQTLDGLAYLHSEGIVHGGLRSTNLLLDSSGRYVISGFSMARRINEPPSEVAIDDTTIFWMAPEVLIEALNSTPDCKSDIWNLGCVAVELWSGKRPWDGQDAAAVRSQLKSPDTKPVDAALVNAEAQSFANRCFTRDPAQRPSANDLQDDAYLVLAEDKTSESLVE